MVAELTGCDDSLIERADFVMDKIQEARAVNRAINIAVYEGWTADELRESIRRIKEEGEFTETRPSFRLDEYRKGIVVATGPDVRDIALGTVVMFAFGRSVNWRSFWRDTIGIASDSKILFTDGESQAVSIPSGSDIHLCPAEAVPMAIPYDISELESVA